MRFRTAGALISAVLATAIGVTAAPAAAAEPGFDVRITELPREFGSGADAATVTVVASTDRGRRCLKVRWSLVVAADGVDLDRIRVDRVEQDGSFPVRVGADGDGARITDEQLDPGRLCRGRTVTARYRVAVSGGEGGRLTFRPQAFDAAGRLLQEASGSSRVAGEPGGTASPSPSASADTSAGAGPEPGEASGEPAGPVGTDGLPPVDLAAAGGSIPSLLGPGLIVGGVLVLLGVGLLMRLRMRVPVSGRTPTGYPPAP